MWNYFGVSVTKYRWVYFPKSCSNSLMPLLQHLKTAAKFVLRKHQREYLPFLVFSDKEPERKKVREESNTNSRQFLKFLLGTSFTSESWVGGANKASA